METTLATLLGLPPVRAARSILRDAWWEVRGRAIRNPAPPVHPVRLLFVCKGNICRSPFAALAAARLLGDAGIQGVECESAGLRVSHERVSPAAAREAARAFGVTMESHRSKELNAGLITGFDAVVVMEPAHLKVLRRLYPEQQDRVYLLPLFAPTSGRPRGRLRYTILDPYGQPREAFDFCYARIMKSLGGLLETMFGGIPCGRA